MAGEAGGDIPFAIRNLNYYTLKFRGQMPWEAPMDYEETRQFVAACQDIEKVESERWVQSLTAIAKMIAAVAEMFKVK